MKTLIIRPGALGDTLLLLPALVGLGGKATVDFAGRQPGLAFMGNAVCRAMDLETAGWHRLFADRPCVPDPSPLPVSGADRIVAFFKDERGIIRRNLKMFFPDALVRIFPAFPPKGKKIHVAQYLTRCLKSAGLPVSDGAVEEAGKRPLLSGLWALSKRDRWISHPGSGDPKKNHSPDFWVNLLLKLREMPRLSHLKPTLLLGPAEAPLQSFFRNRAHVVSPLEILFCPEKEQLLNVLGSTALYLGHDSGITHLSGLMGTPTVALFKQTDPVQWGPLGPRVRIIHGQREDRKLFELITSAAETL